MKKLIIGCLFLAGCNMTPVDSAKECTAMGYKIGTDKHADCQLRLKEIDSRESAVKWHGWFTRNKR